MDNALQWAIGLSLSAGFVLSVTGTYFIRRIAIRRGFVDIPGGHKSHSQPVALGGGIAITAALCGPIVLGFFALHMIASDGQGPDWLPEFLRRHIPGLLSKSHVGLGIVGGALLLHAVGIIDDKKPLGPGVKLLAQVVVAGMLAGLFDLRLLSYLGVIPSVIATVLWIVLITNAFNFLDNMDGLSAGVATIAAAIFALTSASVGQIFVPALACLLVGVMLGFLWHNFPPAKIFMGDSGSLVVGYFLAILTILPTYWDSGLQEAPVGLLVPIVVLAVPLYDTVSVVLIRLRSGTSPFRGDQRHFSHRLVQRGMRPTSAVLTIYLATAATGLSAIALPHADWPIALLVLGQCVCVVSIIAILEQAKPDDAQ